MVYDPQECRSTFPSGFDPNDYQVQRKYDGTRMIIRKHNSTITMYGKSYLKEYSSHYPMLIEDLMKIPGDFDIEGELVFYGDDSSTEKFFTAGVLYNQCGLCPHIMLFDVITYNGKQLYKHPQCERSEFLEDNFNHLDCLSVVETHRGNHGQQLFNLITSQGGEGIIYKKVDAPYSFGKRLNWIKQKQKHTEDCIILGITAGTGARSNTFGSLMVGQYINGVLKHVGNVSGFSQNEHKYLVKLISDIPDEHHVCLPSRSTLRSIEPRLVVEVEFLERTNTDKLRHPRFIRLREDKHPKECKYDTKTAKKISIQSSITEWQ